MTSNFLVLGFVAGVALVACGGRTPIGTVVYIGDDASVSVDASLDEQKPPSKRSALLNNSCGPTDQLAIELSIASIPTLQCGQPISNPLVDILMWDPPTAPGTFSLEFGSNGNATATVCQGGPCKTPTSGTLIFTTYDPKGTTVVGTYFLVFSKGPSESGSFTATQCHGPAMCG